MTAVPPDATTPGRALGRCLIAAAAAYLILVVLMTVVTALGAPEGETVVAQIADLARDDTLYRLGFFLASLLPAAMVPFMVVIALGVAAPSLGRGRHRGATLRLDGRRARRRLRAAGRRPQPPRRGAVSRVRQRDEAHGVRRPARDDERAALECERGQPRPPAPRRPPAASLPTLTRAVPPIRAIWSTGPVSAFGVAGAASAAGRDELDRPGVDGDADLAARVQRRRDHQVRRRRGPRSRSPLRHGDAGEEVHAGEGGDERRRRRPHEVVHGPVLDDPALVDDDDAVGEARPRRRSRARRGWWAGAAPPSQLESSRETCALVTESSAERGSSSSSTRGDLPTARARAARWRSPPEICAGTRAAERRDAEALEQRRDPLVPLAPPVRPRPQTVGDVARHREMREERAVLEHHADGAVLRRQHQTPPGVDERAVVLARCGPRRAAGVPRWRAARTSCRRRTGRRAPASRGPARSVRRARSAAGDAAARRSAPSSVTPPSTAAGSW